MGHGIAQPHQGAQSSTRRLLDFIMKTDDDVKISTVPNIDRITSTSRMRFSFSGTPIDCTRWMLQSTRDVARICSKSKIDIVNVHLYGGYCTRTPKHIPTVITPHDELGIRYWDSVSPWYLSAMGNVIRSSNRWFVRQALRNGLYAVAISSPIKNQLSRMGIHSDRIKVIPHGFPSNSKKKNHITKSALIAKLGIPPNAIIVLSVGTVFFAKGIHKVASAARILENIDPPIHFIHVGKITNLVERGYVEGLKQRLDVHSISNFHLLGSLEHETLLSVMNAVDVYLSASYTEGCGQSLMEAMSSGLPIVSTDVGVARDLLGDHDNLLPSRCTPNQIARAVINSIDLQRRNYAIVDTLTWKAVASKTLLFYREILESWERLT